MAVSLTDVETAISTIQSGGQSFSIDGMTYNAANLDALLRLRTQLKAELDRANGTRPVFRGFKFDGMAY